jgi:muramoyltetrapeptide carboxypeptidase LdcA involved in peptidoglycan recycling
MIASKRHRGDEVRMVSPAVGLGFIAEDQKSMARERLEGLGLRLSCATNAEVRDRCHSSPVEARVSDLHEAFADSGVRGILTTLGGYNSNGLLEYLDYDLIRRTPRSSAVSRTLRVLQQQYTPGPASSTTRGRILRPSA